MALAWPGEGVALTVHFCCQSVGRAGRAGWPAVPLGGLADRSQASAATPVSHRERHGGGRRADCGGVDHGAVGARCWCRRKRRSFRLVCRNGASFTTTEALNCDDGALKSKLSSLRDTSCGSRVKENEVTQCPTVFWMV
jgi:hypothetical protein